MGVLKEWIRGCTYTLLCGDDTAEINDVIFDSRKAAEGTVFVCMQGSRTDSHDFIPDVLSRGCRVLVVEKELSELPAADYSDVTVLKTGSARKAIACLSRARFGYPSEKMCMIGLTGTKGKTSTSYMFRTMLMACGRKVGVIGTNGVMIGDSHYETKNTTPDSYDLNMYFAKMLEEGCDTVVMECSSQGFKMDRTAGITFDYGVFLNISPDHIGPLEHADFDEYLYCKSRLFAQCRTAIINRDDPKCDTVLSQPELGYQKLITFAVDRTDADLKAGNLRFRADAEFAGTEFTTEGLVSDQFALSIPGEFNVSNVLPVLIVASELQLSMESVKAGLRSVHVDGRMEVVYKSDRFSVIVDYAHNEVSMVNLMKTLESYDHKRLVVVFGCGGNRAKDRRTGMGAAAAHAADFTIITEDNSRYEKVEDIMADIEDAYLQAGGAADSYTKVPNRRDAIRYAMEHAQDGDIIAVIGKGHEDYQETNGVRTHFLDKEEIIKIRDELGL